MVTRRGEFFSHKLLTTPGRSGHRLPPESCARLLAARGGSGREVTEVLHATTIATNAILEGKTARLGTAHCPRIPRCFGNRTGIFAAISILFSGKAAAAGCPRTPAGGERADRRPRQGVPQPLAKREVVRAGRDLARAGVEVILVCFINAAMSIRGTSGWRRAG